MSIAHDSRVSCLNAQVRKLNQITGKFSLNCCCDQWLRPRSKQIRQRVRDAVSTRKINNVSRFHDGVSHWLPCCLSTTKQPDMTPTFKLPKHQIQS
jgi:hypothetical protein